ALPFLTLLAPSERFYAAAPRPPKTRLDWARQAVLQIHRWLPERRIVIVADSAPELVEGPSLPHQKGGSARRRL
ncbi:MAG TPA: hypothetical protein VJ770_02160, partial [Stellaceae bacterium]|nr:hypothetical protein [Stellaceae bacterium]